MKRSNLLHHPSFEQDVLSLNLPIKHLKRGAEYPIVSLAGHKFERYEFQGSVNVKDEGGRSLSIGKFSQNENLWRKIAFHTLQLIDDECKIKLNR
jgi:hypothetical protein